MILLVDDDPNFLEYAHAAFGRQERVYFASNADHAMMLLGYIGADVGIALIDLDLPGMSGFDLISRIRNFDSKLPVVAVSGVVNEAALESAKEFGAIETLRKPITRDWKPVIDRIRRRRPAAGANQS